MKHYTSMADKLAAVDQDAALSSLLVNQLIKRVTVNGPNNVSIDFAFGSDFGRVIDIELDRLREIHTKLKMQTSQMQMVEKEKRARTELAQEVSEAGGLTAGLAEALIDRVFVYPDNRVEILWKMKDCCVEK